MLTSKNGLTNCLVDNYNNPDALFKAKNTKKRQHHLVHVEKWQKAEEAEECRKVVKVEECQKVAEVDHKVYCKVAKVVVKVCLRIKEEAKCKAEEEAAM